MTTRTLPYSDELRNASLMAAKAKNDSIVPASDVLNPTTVSRLNILCPDFNSKMTLRAVALAKQTKATKTLNVLKTLLRKYISHFIQAFNNGVDRDVYEARRPCLLHA